MLILLSYALQGIGSCNGNLLLNAPDALFLLSSQVKTSVQGVGAAAVDFDKLFLIEDLLFGNEAGADGEVLLGTYIVFLKVIALVETCAVEAPVPCDELDAKPGGMGSQHGSIEVSQQAVVTGQALGLQGRGLFQQCHVLPHGAGQIGGSLTGSFPFRRRYILLPVANASVRCDPAKGETIPLHRKQFILFRLRSESLTVESGAKLLQKLFSVHLLPPDI